MSNQDWHNADIIAAVKKASGLSLRKLSINNNLNSGACQQALHRPYATPEQVIADAITVPVHLIWPTRYNANGTRKRLLHAATDKSITNNFDNATLKSPEQNESGAEK
jgi:Ner family transcriptional regulator